MVANWLHNGVESERAPHVHPGKVGVSDPHLGEPGLLCRDTGVPACLVTPHRRLSMTSPADSSTAPVRSCLSGSPRLLAFALWPHLLCPKSQPVLGVLSPRGCSHGACPVPLNDSAVCFSSQSSVYCKLISPTQISHLAGQTSFLPQSHSKVLGRYEISERQESNHDIA